MYNQKWIKVISIEKCDYFEKGEVFDAKCFTHDTYSVRFGNADRIFRKDRFELYNYRKEKLEKILKWN